MNPENTIIEKIENIYKTSNFEQKQSLATKIAENVKDGDVIGFGSGTTSFLAVQAIADKVQKENLKIIAIPTSNEITQLCQYYSIQTATLNNVKIDWAFDGTDEIDKNNNLIKGKGKCMFKEKLNFLNSPKVYILADETKFVKNLGEQTAIPVECYKGATEYVKAKLLNLGATSCELVYEENEPALTDSDNYIISAKFNSININKQLENNMKLITGVIETGLFFGYKNIQIL